MSVSVLVIVRRCRIELPAVTIALDDFVGPFELLVVLVFDAERAPDVVDAVLVGCRIVSTWRLVAYRVRVFPAGVDVAAGQRRARLRVFCLRVV